MATVELRKKNVLYLDINQRSQMAQMRIDKFVLTSILSVCDMFANPDAKANYSQQRI